MSIKELDAGVGLETIASAENIVLDFYADWCGPCKALSSILNSIKEDDSNIKYDIIKINIDKHNNLASSYGVRSLPTLVFLQNKGEKLEKLHQKVGSMNKDKFLETLASVYE